MQLHSMCFRAVCMYSLWQRCRAAWLPEAACIMGKSLLWTHMSINNLIRWPQNLMHICIVSNNKAHTADLCRQRCCSCNHYCMGITWMKYKPFNALPCTFVLYWLHMIITLFVEPSLWRQLNIAAEMDSTCYMLDSVAYTAADSNLLGCQDRCCDSLHNMTCSSTWHVVALVQSSFIWYSMTHQTVKQQQQQLQQV